MATLIIEEMSAAQDDIDHVAAERFPELHPRHLCRPSRGPLRGHGLSCLRMKLAIARDMGCGNDRVTPRHDVNFLNDPSTQNCNRREQAMALIHLVCIYDIDRLRWTFLVSAVAITPSLAAARPHTARCSRLPPHSTIPPAENAGSPRSRPSVPSMLVAGQRLRRQ